MERADLLVVGGGLVGLATALAAQTKAPGLRVVALEKERSVAMHQSGRNSGVVHAGLYYPPGSQKARLCAKGREALYRFCQEHGVAHRRCGKLVAAMEERELASLAQLEERARANGLAGVERLDRAGVARVEPACPALAGLWIPQTGVVDFAAVARVMAALVVERGGAVATGARVVEGREQADGVVVETTAGRFCASWLVNCAGLHADRVALALGCEPQATIAPFRGAFWRLTGSSADLVRGLIYPVPDPRFPFLGVHLTRRVDGVVEAGPNASLALRREGYRLGSFAARDALELLRHRGLRTFLRHNWRTGARELALTASGRAFARAVQRLAPAVRSADLVRSRSGVRAQAITADGELVKDFLLQRTSRCVHVLNAPSPAATACLAIGERIAQSLEGLRGRRGGAPLGAGA